MKKELRIVSYLFIFIMLISLVSAVWWNPFTWKKTSFENPDATESIENLKFISDNTDYEASNEDLSLSPSASDFPISDCNLGIGEEKECFYEKNSKYDMIKKYRPDITYYYEGYSKLGVQEPVIFKHTAKIEDEKTGKIVEKEIINKVYFSPRYKLKLESLSSDLKTATISLTDLDTGLFLGTRNISAPSKKSGYSYAQFDGGVIISHSFSPTDRGVFKKAKNGKINFRLESNSIDRPTYLNFIAFLKQKGYSLTCSKEIRNINNKPAYTYGCTSSSQLFDTPLSRSAVKHSIGIGDTQEYDLSKQLKPKCYLNKEGLIDNNALKYSITLVDKNAEGVKIILKYPAINFTSEEIFLPYSGSQVSLVYGLAITVSEDGSKASITLAEDNRGNYLDLTAFLIEKCNLKCADYTSASFPDFKTIRTNAAYGKFSDGWSFDQVNTKRGGVWANGYDTTYYPPVFSEKIKASKVIKLNGIVKDTDNKKSSEGRIGSFSFKDFRTGYIWPDQNMGWKSNSVVYLDGYGYEWVLGVWGYPIYPETVGANGNEYTAGNFNYPLDYDYARALDFLKKKCNLS